MEPLGETGYGRLHIIHTSRHSGVVGIPVVILKGKSAKIFWQTFNYCNHNKLGLTNNFI